MNPWVAKRLDPNSARLGYTHESSIVSARQAFEPAFRDSYWRNQRMWRFRNSVGELPRTLSHRISRETGSYIDNSDEPTTRIC
jgi:hypothetical protein